MWPRNAMSVLLTGSLAAALAGCASSASDDRQRAGVSSTPASTQQTLAEHARDFRSQAYALTEMANRRQVEADVLAKELGPDHPSVEKKRRLVEELRAAAEDADQQARSLRRDVPHGMVQ